jgi:hypothetical protein
LHPTNAHFSSSWRAVVLGGTGHEFVVQLLGVGTGQAAEAGDGGAVDAGEPAGLADAAAIGDVGQDRLGLVRGQAAVEQGRALALGEAGLARAAVEQAALVRAVAGADGQIAVAAFPVVRTLGCQAAEAIKVVHGAWSWGAGRGRWTPG